MPMRITVALDCCKILDGNNLEPEKTRAKYCFTATLQNVGDVSLYDAVITLECNRHINLENHDDDLVIDRANANSASFRVSVPIHPNDRERHVSWFVTAKPFPNINPLPETQTDIKFTVCAKDSQPEKLVVEFDARDIGGPCKEALHPE